MSLSLQPPTVTPEAVKRMGKQLGINLDDAQSMQLLSVARLLLTLPLPTHYKHALNAEQQSVFVDKRTSHASERHPMLDQAKKLVVELQRRKGLSAAASPSAQPPAPAEQAGPADTSTERAENTDASILRDQPGTEAGADTAAADAAPAPHAPLATSPTAPDTAGPHSKVQTVMAFTRPGDGTTHYYDFASSSELPGQPEDGQVIEAPPHDLLRQYGLLPADAGSLATLRFYSWWYEDYESSDLTLRLSGNSEAGGGLKKRYVTVEYDVASQTFTIRSVTDNQEIAIANILAVTSKSGSTVEVWDLHVGATLNIMGRMVALMKADGATVAWNEFHAKRLKKIKVQLQDELDKYRMRAHKMGVTFDRGDTQHGGLALRYTVNQIHALADELHTYRPSIAAQLRALVQIPA